MIPNSKSSFNYSQIQPCLQFSAVTKQVISKASERIVLPQTVFELNPPTPSPSRQFCGFSMDLLRRICDAARHPRSIQNKSNAEKGRAVNLLANFVEHFKPPQIDTNNRDTWE